MDRKTTVREDVMAKALEAITADRNADYGDPEDNFRIIRNLWVAYLNELHRDLLPHDVAVLMILVKVARLVTSPTNRDNWVDIAGYAGCGAEAAELAFSTLPEKGVA